MSVVARLRGKLCQTRLLCEHQDFIEDETQCNTVELKTKSLTLCLLPPAVMYCIESFRRDLQV